MSTAECVTFTISGTASAALQIDTRDARTESYRWGRGVRVVVTCSRDVAEDLCEEAEDRYMNGPRREGYAQPASWANACADAAREIRAALSVVRS